MQCISPISLKNRYLADGRGGVSLALGRQVPCGRCYPCRQNLSRSWQFRLQQEEHFSKCSFFVTLTYSDDNLPSDFKLQKRDVQLFLKRFRKLEDFPRQLKYFCVGEYGGKFGRPHYHLLMFFSNYRDIFAVDSQLQKSWNVGFTHIGSVSAASINYVCGYVIGRKDEDENFKTFSLCSNGLGSKYLDTHCKILDNTERDFTARGVGGSRYSLPRYYRDRLFSDERKLQHINDLNDFISNRLEHYDRDNKLHQSDVHRHFEIKKQSYLKKRFKHVK